MGYGNVVLTIFETVGDCGFILLFRSADFLPVTLDTIVLLGQCYLLYLGGATVSLTVELLSSA